MPTSQLARIPPADPVRLRLEQVALPVPPGYRAAPDDAAGPLMTRRPLGDEVVAVVIADGLVVGPSRSVISSGRCGGGRLPAHGPEPGAAYDSGAISRPCGSPPFSKSGAMPQPNLPHRRGAIR
jgi:hypothetical protein